MKHLFYIKVPFKRAIKKGYPIYYYEPFPIKDINIPINKELTKKDYTYKYCDDIFDINGKSDSSSCYLYSKIPLIYSNIGWWIVGYIMSLGLVFLSQVKLTSSPIMQLFIVTIVLVTWLSLFGYWQKDKLDKWIIKQLNK